MDRLKDIKTIAWVGDPHLSDIPPRSRKDEYLMSILNKLDAIFLENDLVIVLGDLFDKRNLSNRGVIELVKMLKKHGFPPFYSIPGNHDVYNYNIHTLPKTTLGVLVAVGVVKLLNQLKVGNILIESLPFERDPEVPKATMLPDTENVIRVLVGHCFFEGSFDPSFSITRSDVMGCGYDFLVLGHDHNVYKPVKVGKTNVVRVSSLSRGTSHEFNLKRMPYYLQTTLPGTVGDGFFQQRDVSADLPEEVFREEAIEKGKLTNSVAFSSNLSELLKNFEHQTTLHKKHSLKEILKRMKVPTAIIAYLQDVHERNFINF